jgi:hypothetical protein
LPESKSVSVSRIIAAAIENGVIKADEKVGASRKFARYLPHWGLKFYLKMTQRQTGNRR